MIALRLAVPADALAVARIHVRAWQAAYRGLLPDAYLDGLRVEDRAGRYTFGDTSPGNPATLLAVEGETVCGFATTGPSRSLEGAGELMVSTSTPAIGAAASAASSSSPPANARSCKATRPLCCWSWKAINARRASTSPTAGLPTASSATDEVWGTTVTDLRYARSLK